MKQTTLFVILLYLITLCSASKFIYPSAGQIVTISNNQTHITSSFEYDGEATKGAIDYFEVVLSKNNNSLFGQRIAAITLDRNSTAFTAAFPSEGDYTLRLYSLRRESFVDAFYMSELEAIQRNFVSSVSFTVSYE